MRHDPASGAIVVMLKSLKMHGMAQAVSDLIAQGAPAFDAAVPILSQLLKAETAEREVRSVAYQLKVARFPAYRDLAGFDFASSEINEALVRQLHRCDFIDVADNVVLVGGPGTGKTHVATALGVQAIEHHSTGSGCASSPRSSWSTLSNRKRRKAGPDRSPTGLSTPIS
jgi:DNA replication protein DnaC